jgi:hypothetical protein
MKVDRRVMSPNVAKTVTAITADEWVKTLQNKAFPSDRRLGRHHR